MLPNNHNGGPPLDPFAAIATHIDDLYQLAEGCLTGGEIANAEQAEQIEALKNDIKKAAADAEKARKAEKEPHLEAGRNVDKKWKSITDKAAIAVKTASAALTPWKLKVAAEKASEQERLRKEADEKAEAARLAFTETAPTDLEARATAEIMAKEAAKATSSANKIERSATGLRTYWVAEVKDYGALLAHLKRSEPDELRSMLDSYVERAKNRGVRTLAGVEFTEHRKAV